MTFRHFILVGAVAGLLVAGLHNTARATTFTNGDLITHGQGEWGDDPTTGLAAELLLANYDTVYASQTGLFIIGGYPSGFSAVFDNASHVLAYLPTSGAIGPLDADLVNPTSTPSGAFGGEVAALKLNIDFSDAGLLPGNLNVRFGDLVLQNFNKLQGNLKSLRSLNGLTVRQFMAESVTV
jgi:hypothetical protein